MSQAKGQLQTLRQKLLQGQGQKTPGSDVPPNNLNQGAQLDSKVTWVENERTQQLYQPYIKALIKSVQGAQGNAGKPAVKTTPGSDRIITFQGANPRVTNRAAKLQDLIKRDGGKGTIFNQYIGKVQRAGHPYVNFHPTALADAREGLTAVQSGLVGKTKTRQAFRGLNDSIVV